MNKKVKGLKTKNKILDKALICFSNSGFDNTSINQICNEAGVSKGAFYYHFESKQHLFLELISKWLKKVDNRLELEGIDLGNVRESISAISNAAMFTFKEASSNAPLFLEIWLKTARDPEIYEKLIKPYKKYLNYFKNLIKKSVESNNLKEINPEYTARLIIALSIGSLLQSYFEKENQNWEKIINEAFLIFTQGILTNGR